MIPDHLIDQAAAGIDKFLAELQRGDWDNYPGLLARAALEAVAADIWDEATSAQAEWEWLAERGREGDRPNPQDANPYRASEEA